MTIVAKMASVLQSVFNDSANKLAMQCGVIKRQRKFSGSSLARMLVFGLLGKRQSTLDDLAQQAASCGISVSPQAVAQRFNVPLAEFLRKLLEEATLQLISAKPRAIALLQKFSGGVWILDSTVINLPAEWAQQWPSCGGVCGQSPAALKVQVRFNYSSGCCDWFHLEPARKNDLSSLADEAPLPKNSLRLADLGYFSLSALKRHAEEGSFFLTRLTLRTALWTLTGERLGQVARWLKSQRHQLLEIQVRLGNEEQLESRLIAIPAPVRVVRQRRKRLRDDARRRGRKISPEQWEWTRWTVFATNIPIEMATWEEVVVLYRTRWQIERLFRLWKSEDKLRKSRSKDPVRFMIEVYAVLLGLLVQHWLLLTTAWSAVNVSIEKTAAVLQLHVAGLNLLLDSIGELTNYLQKLCAMLARPPCLNTRKKQPSSYQLLTQNAITTWD